MKKFIFLVIFATLLLTLFSCDIPVGSLGQNGNLGEDGITPTISISDDGYWVINGEKTNVRAEANSTSEDSANPQGLDFYLKDDGTYAVAIGRAKYLSKIVIPETYCGKAVTEIAYEGFSGEKLPLKEIVIPDTVQSIGERAFSGCSSLTAVRIPDGVTSIGDSTFSGCSALTAVRIPDSVTNIGQYAFASCSSLTAVKIPDGVTSIGFSTFSNCSGLTTVTIPDSVKGIGNNAFAGCSSLTTVTIPDSVKNIGQYAFEGCSGLTAVTISESVEAIVHGTFSSCFELTSIILPKSVTYIYGNSFYGCSKLTYLFYTGTAAEWGVRIEYDYNDEFFDATRYYYSESEPTETGNFWHYVNGIPTIWDHTGEE